VPALVGVRGAASRPPAQRVRERVVLAARGRRPAPRAVVARAGPDRRRAPARGHRRRARDGGRRRSHPRGPRRLTRPPGGLGAPVYDRAVLPLRDNVPTRRFPVMTVAIIAANFVVWFWELGVNERQVDRYAFYPCDVSGPCLQTFPHLAWWETAFSSMF